MNEGLAITYFLFCRPKTCGLGGNEEIRAPFHLLFTSATMRITLELDDWVPP
jgi:hypothetical protein